VLTRFPPEPNGYLHIGHAKSICLNFGIARQFGSRCHLRFDDTNPTKEEVEYVEAIEADVRWLGFDFGEKALYASDYFEEMYRLGEKLITDGKAYVCSLDEAQIRAHRGSLTEPGTLSPFASRTPAESLDLFRRMRAGEFPDGAHVLRARIDMSAANMKMRDPLLYRIRKATHHRTGDAWCIYPMYDYAHPLSDAFEGITHSICTLEFENNRELYDWVIEATGVTPLPSFGGPGLVGRPHQIEFARLSLDYTVMSKRKLLLLVEGGHVRGWDDPRMPTIAGMRRRGYRPEALRAFADMIGVAKANSVVDFGKLEFCVRNDLQESAPRALGVLRPLKLTITTLPADHHEELEAPYYPEGSVAPPGATTSRRLPFSRELFIEHDDFREDPPKDYHRLAPGRVVRLRHAYCVRCDEVVRDGAGQVVELRCAHLPDTLGKNPDGVKVAGVLHWVSARHALPAEVRLYDRLFKSARPEDGDGDFLKELNPASLEVVKGARLEPSLAAARPEDRIQLERLGYFCLDADSGSGRLVWNRIITLRDSYAVTRPAVTPERAPAPPATATTAREKARPQKRSPAEVRAEARARDSELLARYTRLMEVHRLRAEEADLLTADREVADLFEATVGAGAAPDEAARWIINEVPRELKERPISATRLSGPALGALIGLVVRGDATRPVAKELLATLVASGGDPAALLKARGSKGCDDATVARLVDEVLAAHADKVSEYRQGRTGLFGFFVGQVVKASGGAASPPRVKELLTHKLA
jgi:glutaminyl-tRNA synthetase